LNAQTLIIPIDLEVKEDGLKGMGPKDDGGREAEALRGNTKQSKDAMAELEVS
jgi:hypothetical protein